ncbi:hypothetical protein [Stenomitos frigidus]|uniref:Uncharacterized protein n=1 Tax=Stenomitos frigidus ULC18 TaxID=2107698 RepID=A0A2T1E1X5_9CYAN|nr:hypothetical protein [Stenomitos frigidus]PSB26739.1 hypothetical protein C7B82_18840 [Stenomitos frigidus ULC18]
MSAPFRITRPSIKRVAADKADGLKDYLGRLIKLIPAEVISLYLVGKGVIATGQASETPLSYWIVWTVFCLVAVLVVRIFGTADPKENQPPQILAVLIACVSYLVWIYSMGDVFALLNLYEPKLGSLMVLGWSFVVPYFYKGDRATSRSNS